MNLMTFRDYWHAMPVGPVRLDFAARCGSTVGYFNLIASGHKTMGESLALKVEHESGGLVPVETTRPDVPWHVIRGKPLQASDNSAPTEEAA